MDPPRKPITASPDPQDNEESPRSSTQPSKQSSEGSAPSQETSTHQLNDLHHDTERVSAPEKPVGTDKDLWENHVLKDFYTLVTPLRPLSRESDNFGAFKDQYNDDEEDRWSSDYRHLVSPGEGERDLWPAPLNICKLRHEGHQGEDTTGIWSPGRTNSILWMDKGVDHDSEEGEAAMCMAVSGCLDDMGYDREDGSSAGHPSASGNGDGRKEQRGEGGYGYPFLDAEASRRSRYHQITGRDSGPACIGSEDGLEVVTLFQGRKIQAGELDIPPGQDSREQEAEEGYNPAPEQTKSEFEQQDPIVLAPDKCRMIEQLYRKLFGNEPIKLDSLYKTLVSELYTTIQVQRAKAKFIRSREREEQSRRVFDATTSESKGKHREHQFFSVVYSGDGSEVVARQEDLHGSNDGPVLGSEAGPSLVISTSSDIDTFPSQKASDSHSEGLVSDLAGGVSASSQHGTGIWNFKRLSRPWSTLTGGGGGPWSEQSERRMSEGGVDRVFQSVKRNVLRKKKTLEE